MGLFMDYTQTETEIRRLSRKLAALDKAAQELDEKLGDLRIEIHNLFWNIAGSAKEQQEKR
jgi:septal ring factor EnvC (AmiA/AmiB activator)